MAEPHTTQLDRIESLLQRFEIKFEQVTAEFRQVAVSQAQQNADIETLKARVSVLESTGKENAERIGNRIWYLFAGFVLLLAGQALQLLIRFSVIPVAGKP